MFAEVSGMKRSFSKQNRSSVTQFPVTFNVSLKILFLHLININAQLTSSLCSRNCYQSIDGVFLTFSSSSRNEAGQDAVGMAIRFVCMVNDSNDFGLHRILFNLQGDKKYLS